MGEVDPVGNAGLVSPWELQIPMAGDALQDRERVLDGERVGGMRSLRVRNFFIFHRWRRWRRYVPAACISALRVWYSEIKDGSFWRFLDGCLPWFHRLRSVLPWLKIKKIKPFESSVEWNFFIFHRWRRWRRFVPVACISALRVRYSEIKVGSFCYFWMSVPLKVIDRQSPTPYYD